MDLVLDKFHEECGVVAVYQHPEAAKMAYLGLHALQHRGQESAGITASNGFRLRNEKGMGLVGDIFTAPVLARLQGPLAIGHTRYSTTGDSALLNAQPLRVECNKGSISVAHNGNLVNAAEVRARLEAHGSIFQTTSDTEVILHLIAQSKECALAEAITDALRRIEGAFSLVLLTPDRIFAIRDPRGFRPLSMGRIKDNTGHGQDAIVLASETTALDLIGATFERDVLPGEMLVIGPEGIHSRFYSAPQPMSACIFEHVYFSRPDSVVFGRPVNLSREALGRELAKESPVDADIVVAVPDSGVPAAVGYAAQSGIPFRIGLVRSHYVGRTFIEPEQGMRDFGVRLKLNAVRSIIEGKRVILIDDSIVRGTTSKKIVRMIRASGAREVHMRISGPPTISPCYYGVDTPSKKQLIAANQTIEEICHFIGADSLAYLSVEGLKYACGEGVQGVSYCAACYTGKYPTNHVDVDEIEPAEVAKD